VLSHHVNELQGSNNGNGLRDAKVFYTLEYEYFSLNNKKASTNIYIHEM